MKTVVQVDYPRHRGALGLRGTPPLSWDDTARATSLEGGLHVFELDVPEGTLLEFKIVRGDEAFSAGRNHTVLAGDTLVVEPHFDRTTGALDAAPQSIGSKELGRPVRFRVLVPPSYGELEHRRYPVLYAQDAQALFRDSPDPLDGSSWRLDETLDELWELGAAEEMIVVAVYTDENRLDILSPAPDAVHGGGKGPAYLSFLVESLKPFVDTFYRTDRERGRTAILGSSMGGLFSFFAAWTRSDVFGRAACLSSSFWWADRWMVHEVQKGACPLPRPMLYVDSGAAKSALTEDANLRDGFHHTVALRNALVDHCYVPGSDLFVLAFAGATHDTASWGARLAVPIQLLFPPRSYRPSPPGVTT